MRSLLLVIFLCSSGLEGYETSSLEKKGSCERQSTTSEKSRKPLDLIRVFKETLRAAHYGYTSPKGIKVRINPASVQAMQTGTKLFYKCPRFTGKKGQYKTTFEVVNQDSLCAAKAFAIRGKRPLVLNLANAKTPGGGVRKGSRAQEEGIFRCTNYDDALNPNVNPVLERQLTLKNRAGKKLYRIPETGAILTPHVTVIRNARDRYAFLDKPFEVDMLASAAYNQKPGHWGGS